MGGAGWKRDGGRVSPPRLGSGLREGLRGWEGGRQGHRLTPAHPPAHLPSHGLTPTLLQAPCPSKPAGEPGRGQGSVPSPRRYSCIQVSPQHPSGLLGWAGPRVGLQAPRPSREEVLLRLPLLSWFHHHFVLCCGRQESSSPCSRRVTCPGGFSLGRRERRVGRGLPPLGLRSCRACT